MQARHVLAARGYRAPCLSKRRPGPVFGAMPDAGPSFSLDSPRHMDDLP